MLVVVAVDGAARLGQPSRGTSAAAQHRLEQLLGRLHELGAKAEGELGHADPLEAIGQVLATRDFDEVILSTLPQPISRWLRMDLSRQVRRGCGLPVVVITAPLTHSGPPEAATLPRPPSSFAEARSPAAIRSRRGGARRLD
jgi:hypothetical protein